MAGQVVEDVAERDELRREVRHLDADRLLAGDRREDADLGRRERVGEVVLERRRPSRPSCPARAGARSATTRGPAIWPTIVASTPKCASVCDELLGGARARVAVVALDRRRRLEQRAVRQPVLAGRRRRRSRARRSSASTASGSLSSSGSTSGGGSGATAPRRRRRDSSRRRRPAARRRRSRRRSSSSSAIASLGSPLEAVERAPSRRSGPAHGSARAAQQRARRGAGERAARRRGTSATPTISAPVSPITCASPPPRAPPTRRRRPCRGRS